MGGVLYCGGFYSYTSFDTIYFVGARPLSALFFDSK